MDPSSHITLFMDFIGFSDAVRGGDRQRVGELTDLLVWVASNEREFTIDARGEGDGSYKFNTNPNITAFSDNVVISYPFAVEQAVEVEGQAREILKQLWIDLVLKHMQEIVGTVAYRSIEIDMLVRGGLSVGPLVHQGRVVIGEGMIDAYELERKVAIYPRVAVSPRLYQEITDSNRTDRLILDADGVYHLDFFAEMALAAEQQHGSDGARSWRAEKLKRLDEIRAKLQADERTGPAAKWKQFRNYLENATLAYS
jgi:hypothetical protein